MADREYVLRILRSWFSDNRLKSTGNEPGLTIIVTEEELNKLAEEMLRQNVSWGEQYLVGQVENDEEKPAQIT